MIRSYRLLVHSLNILCCTLAISVQANAEIVTAFMQSGKPAGWQLEKEIASDGLIFSDDPQKPGLFFREPTDVFAEGQGEAWTTWPVGTGPFVLQWQVEIEQGTEMGNRWPGAMVGLSTAQPGQMGEDDLTISIATLRSGVTAAVFAGEAYQRNQNKEGHPPYLTRWEARELTSLRPGGTRPSIFWPGARALGTVGEGLAGTQLTCRIERDTANRVTFTLFHDEVDGGRTPWWIGEWEAPEELGGKEFRFVTVKMVPGPRGHPVHGQRLHGRIYNLQGWTPVAAAPVLTGYESEKAALASGDSVTLEGDGFEQGATVLIDGKPAAGATVENAFRIRIVLPEVEDSAARQEVVVTNPTGLNTRMRDWLGYGRQILRATPSEPPLAGGEITLIGHGFGPKTQIWIDEQPARVIEVTDRKTLRFEAPARQKPGPAALRVEEAGERFSGAPAFGYAAHPYLLHTRDSLAGLKQKFHSPAFANYRQVILGVADTIVERGPRGAGRGDLISVLYAYLLTGEQKYFDSILVQVETTERSINYGDFELISTMGMAFTYDSLADTLPAERREALEAYLDRGIAAFIQRAEGGLNRNNIGAVIACGGGIAALSRIHSNPDAPRAVELAVEGLRTFAQFSMLADGSYNEGALYWAFGVTHYVVFAHALRNTTGDDVGLFDHAGLKNNHRFVETILGGDGLLIPYNDSQPFLTGEVVAAEVGARFDRPLMRWLADEIFRNQIAQENYTSRPMNTVFAFLWRDETPAEFPGLPTLSVLEIQNWAALRSDGALHPAIMVGVKGEGRDANTGGHAQADLGSFVLQARGESFLIDPGYYQPDPDAHSLPLIGGKGPSRARDQAEYAMIVDDWEQGSRRGVTVDATSAYANADRVRRHFVMVDDKAVVVLDDVLPKNEGDRITAQFQAGFPVELQADGGRVRINGVESDLHIQIFGPNLKLSSKGPRDWGRSWVFRRLKVIWHTLSGDYQAAPERPLISILSPSGSGEDQIAARVVYAGKKISVYITDGQPLHFTLSEAGWKVER